MADELVTACEAARRLSIRVATLYDWLRESDQGTFALRGQRVTIEYFQGGPNGQGRIRLDAREIERLKDLMRVRPLQIPPRRLPIQRRHYPGINVELGRPD
jgi:hypothetical protein